MCLPLQVYSLIRNVSLIHPRAGEGHEATYNIEGSHFIVITSLLLVFFCTAMVGQREVFTLLYLSTITLSWHVLRVP